VTALYGGLGRHQVLHRREGLGRRVIARWLRISRVTVDRPLVSTRPPAGKSLTPLVRVLFRARRRCR